MNRVLRLLVPGLPLLMAAVLLPAGLAAQTKKPPADKPPAGKPAADKVDFQKQILPILEKNCFECHSSPSAEGGRQKKPKGGVVLDTKDGITTSKKGKVVVAKSPDESKMIIATSLPADDEDRMPPPKKGGPLAKEQVELLKKWVEQGAEFGSWTAAKKDTKKDAGKGKGEAEKPGADKPHAADKPRGGDDDEFPALAQGLQPLDGSAVAKLEAAHAHAESIGGSSPLLRVTFFGHEDEVTDDTLRALAPAREHIVELRLPRTRLTDAAGALLAAMPRLCRLDLRETRIGDAGVAALAALAELRTLNLFGTKVGDQGLSALAACKKLRELYVWQTPVSAAAVVALEQALPKARIVFAADLPDPLAEGQGGGRGRRGAK